jgi:hypothetical protein
LSERFGSQFAAHASMSLRRVGSIALALVTLACFRLGVVEAHGGQLSASANEGHGATFQFVLLLQQEEA